MVFRYNILIKEEYHFIKKVAMPNGFIQSLLNLAAVSVSIESFRGTGRDFSTRRGPWISSVYLRSLS